MKERPLFYNNDLLCSYMKGSVLLDSACYFTGTKASCTDVD